MYSILWGIVSLAMALIAGWCITALMVHLRYKPKKGSVYRMTICEIGKDSGDLLKVSKARNVRFETAFILLNILGSVWEAECLIPNSEYDTLLVSKITDRHAIVIPKHGDLANVMDELYAWETIK